jgi:hypothetical protein
LPFRRKWLVFKERLAVLRQSLSTEIEL